MEKRKKSKQEKLSTVKFYGKKFIINKKQEFLLSKAETSFSLNEKKYLVKKLGKYFHKLNENSPIDRNELLIDLNQDIDTLTSQNKALNGQMLNMQATLLEARAKIISLMEGGYDA